MNDEGDHIRDWTLVGAEGEIESDSSSAATSGGFVNLDEDQVVSYHLKKQRRESLDSDNCIEELEKDSSKANPTETPICAAQESPIDKSDTECDHATLQSAPATVGNLEESESDHYDLIGEDDFDGKLSSPPATSSSPEFLDDAVVSALTASRPDVEISNNDISNKAVTELLSTADKDADPQLSPEESEGEEDLEHVPEDLSGDMAASESDMESLIGSRKKRKISTQSSGIEELEMPGEEEMALYEQDQDEDHDDDSQPEMMHSDILRLRNENRRRSGSDSDLSDIVKIDPSLVEEVPEATFPRQRRHTPASDLMQASASSASSGGSSLSSRFHFVQPLPTHHRYVYPRDNQDDEESLPGDVDDRCESDISGVAPVDSDPDLSSVSYNVDDLEIYEGDVVRSYRHKPNSRLNAFLTALALLTLFTTVGVGIGHYLGTVRTNVRRDQQTARLMELQDDYLRCLRQHEILEAQASVTDQEKIAAVTAVWKEKYEELIIEKVELESLMRKLQAAMSDDLGEAQRKILTQRDGIQDVVDEINQLRSENNLYRDQIQEMEDKESTLVSDNEQLQSRLSLLKERQSFLEGKIEELEREEAQMMEQQASQGEEVTPPETLKNEGSSTGLESGTLVTVQEEDNDDLVSVSVVDEGFDLETGDNTQSHFLSDMVLSDGSKIVYKSTAHMIQQTLLTADSESTVLLLKVLDQVNSLEQENHELRTLVAQLRYSQHQYTIEDVDAVLKSEANRLANENDDLKWVVGKLRYGQPSLEEIEGSPDPQTNTEQISPESPCSSAPNSDSISDVMTFLRGLLPDISTAELKLFSTEFMTNMTEPITAQLEFLQNVTADVKFTETLHQKWEYLRSIQPDHVGNTFRDAINDIQAVISQRWLEFSDYVSLKEFENVKANAKAGFDTTIEGISNSTVIAKYQEFVNKTKHSVSKLMKKIQKRWNKVKNFTGNFLNNNNPVSSFGDSVKENLKQIKKSVESGWKKARKEMTKNNWMPEAWDTVPQSDSSKAKTLTTYHKFVKKTQESVSKLTKKVQKGWDKVKSLTGDFLGANSHVTSFGESVKENLKKLEKSVEASWDKVQRKVEADGWLSQYWKSTGKGSTTQTTDTFSEKRDAPEAESVIEESVENQQQTSVPPEIKSAEEVNTQNKHKKMRSSTADDERYAEYWKLADFEPDDFFQEGFFEGNNREWSKHQKRVKNLVGRFQRLNENLFLSMDDDDIEDMYDDFDDVEDDLDDYSAPDNLMTWLTCQVRWWKSRLYRKHSSEDLLKGCAQKLTQWQLKAMCTPSCQKSKEGCNEEPNQRNLHQDPFCFYYQSVILPSISQENLAGASNDDELKPAAVHQTPRRVVVVKADEKSPVVSGSVDNDYGHIRYTIDMDGADYEESVTDGNVTMELEKNLFDGTAEDDDDDKEHVRWVFERAESRDSHHHDASWAFERGEFRDFQRNKPWFYKRAEHRATERARADYEEIDD